MKFDTVNTNTAKKNEVHAQILAKAEKAETTSLPLKDIEIFMSADGNPQPFKVEKADVDLLADSISKYGQITPITVRKVKGKKKYQILSGHKRYYAMAQNGEKNIDVKIIDCSDEDAYSVLCNANIQRDKPKPSELNAMYYYFKNLLGEETSVRDLSVMFNVSSKTLYRVIHLDDLIPDLVTMVDNEQISTMAIEIIAKFDSTQQSVLADYVAGEEKLLTPATAKKIEKMADEGIEFTIDNIKEWLAPKKKEKENKKYSIDFFNALADENPDRYADMSEQEVNNLIKTLLDSYFADTL